MGEIVKTMKLLLYTEKEEDALFHELTERYAEACTFIAQYIFDHGFELNNMKLQKTLYDVIREGFGLKSQMAISSIRTTTARYKTIQKQMSQSPYKYKSEDGTWKYIPRTLEWMWKPVVFHRPQADLVRGRDYSFVENGSILSINTLSRKRVKVSYSLPECFLEYFDGTWSFGTAKLVSLKGKWYFHIPMTKKAPDTFERECPSHIVGVDRGLRFILNTYDEYGKSHFFSGRDILEKRMRFANVRAELQAKQTRSAKRKLKDISGRENRWMSDVNHQLSKTLVHMYGPGTLFVIEDLNGVSFNERQMSVRTNQQRRELRSWAFYQFEQMLSYKASETGSYVLKVSAEYTSQRCPKCGRIRKENRDHTMHEYICDSCGYRSNDDRVGAMNLYELGALYMAGDDKPKFDKDH